MAGSTWGRRWGLTLGEPLTTRETVARETPASAATCSSVGCPAGPALCGTVTSFLRARCSSASSSRPAAPGSSCPRRQAALPDHLRVPQRAVLGGAPLGGEVDVHQAEPLRVSPGPLEVV